MQLFIHNQTSAAVSLSRRWREAEISLGMLPANERRRYNVMTSLIGWAHT